MFLWKFKKHVFYVFFYFLNVFLFFNDVIWNKNVQNFKYDAFLVGKDSISWTERVLLSSIIDFIWFVLTVLLTWMDSVV